ncbi:hypothetical protein [Glaesserella parasuis]|uniref:Uncharacterized protein n=1 Tax=Glaesserella parasuis serovar 5 (strain SH0165) TaxID=557723 RepID=B8F513_GLAP5|nr:hypothetical protein [Glaesserella parasuis]ACL32415.1 conserved hypothetical protein [Glaesserella parasuis SH0165]MDG6867779.1 hypothetical protein [Glaesserella parasuis]
MTNNEQEKTLKYDLSPKGIGELMKAPIKATLSSLDFPYIRIEQQQDDNGKPFYIGILWLEMGDQIIIEMTGATAFKEALAIIAYQQQATQTPLLIDDEVADSIRYFYEHSQYGDGVNPLIEHYTGNEITLEMMAKANRKQVDLLFMEKRIKGEQCQP